MPGAGVEQHQANPAGFLSIIGYPVVPPQEVVKYSPPRRPLELEADIIVVPRDSQSTSARRLHGHREVPDEQWASTVVCRPASLSPAPATSKQEGNIANKLFLPAGILVIEPSMLFDNPDNVGREHMASERTFLAYIRTGLAIVSAGVIFVQLFAVSNAMLRSQDMSSASTVRGVERFARPLGLVLIALGFSVVMIGGYSSSLPIAVVVIVELGVGLYRYLSVQSALQVQKYPVARVTTAFISFVLGGVTAVFTFSALQTDFEVRCDYF